MDGVLGYHYAPSNTRAGWLTEMKASIRQKLDLLVDRLDEIDRMLSAPGVANDMDQFRKLTRERAELEPVVVKFNAFRQAENDIAEAEALISASTGGAERYRDRMIEEMHVDAARALLARAAR